MGEAIRIKAIDRSTRFLAAARYRRKASADDLQALTDAGAPEWLVRWARDLAPEQVANLIREFKSTKPKPSPTAEDAAAKRAALAKVEKAAAAALRQVRDVQRDELLAARGPEIEPQLRRWASSQPLEVVRSLLAAKTAKRAGSAVRLRAPRKV